MSGKEEARVWRRRGMGKDKEWIERTRGWRWVRGRERMRGKTELKESRE